MSHATPRRPQLILAILALAICAFELFNFDTTSYALSNLLGSSAFYGVTWASILAIAFCGIDLAGLIQLFSPPTAQRDSVHSGNFLFGAWLLGATLNALMTWYAVGLTLLGLNIGNELLSRQQLVQWVPILIAMLVWLTRILFIGALTLMSNELARHSQIPMTLQIKRLSPQREQATLREVAPLQPSRAARRTRADELPNTAAAPMRRMQSHRAQPQA